MKLLPGDLVSLEFPAHMPAGHEQEGYRPAVVVGVPSLAGPVRFPMVFVAPLTTDRGQPWANAHRALYPSLAAGTGSLPAASIVLADQVRAVDLSRIKVRRGTLPKVDLVQVAAAIDRALGLKL